MANYVLSSTLCYNPLKTHKNLVKKNSIYGDKLNVHNARNTSRLMVVLLCMGNFNNHLNIMNFHDLLLGVGRLKANCLFLN